MSDYKQLKRSKKNKIVAGVCGGIGEYFKIDPVIIRLVMVLLGPATIWVYIVMWLVVPEEPEIYKEKEKEVW